ncbi:hypothetical protein RM780_20000 [Streptomyces sp. DSM 44917]|uniref:Uncharacterized protein n=1 Tax=Streptomyces boetiae TaxID=3075541 RepID=A0ABU2LCB7_9ACTN|nr:hypothetical protein [Streptomyces sp. DSM 44917]MDT0309227.1 hypothetical protein [Streptomyces sp. DSM 44917]
MPGTHFALRIDERQIAALADAAVDALARRLADHAFAPLHDDAPEGASPGSAFGGETAHESSSTDALAYLHALVYLQSAVQRRADEAARHAARAGAGYPDLGKVCNITRQGARRRWPGLVPPAPSRPPSDRSSS